MPEFIDEDVQPQVPISMPSPQVPAGMRNEIHQLTPEMLDQMINDPNGHPELRKGAKETKARLFPEQTPKPVKKPPKEKKKAKKVVTQKPKVKIATEIVIQQPDVIELKPERATKEDFEQFMSGIKKELYQDEVPLLSDPGVAAQLKSMSVEEYKFMTKHLEMFEMETKGVKNLKVIAKQELILTNALDTVLQRCLANNIAVPALTVYDWLYLLLALRCVSRPTESNFRITYEGSDKESERVPIDILEILKRLREQRETFIEQPMGYVAITEKSGLYLMLLTRGDMLYIENIFNADPDASLSLLSLGMSAKAFVKDGKALMMSPEQRLSLFKTLDYAVLKEMKKIYMKNEDAFFKVINEYLVEEFGSDVKNVVLSDFILFFYDF